MKFECPNYGKEPNMVVTITTEQPSKYYKKLPSQISLNSKKSLNSTWVGWDDVGWICPDCRQSGKSLLKDCKMVF